MCLERQLKSWEKGDIGDLLHEGHTIQNQLPNDLSNRRSEAQVARSFAKLMFEGKFRPAIRLLMITVKEGD